MARSISNRNDMDTVYRHIFVSPPTPDGCWLWTGSIQSGGYGQIEVAGRLWLAHRFAWSMYHEREPNALMLHRCDTPACVNPAHLFEGTHLDNHRDAVAKGRFDPVRISTFAKQKRTRKLTDDQVRDIRSGRESDLRYAVLYGVSKSTVCDIRNRKSKRLVPDAPTSMDGGGLTASPAG